MFSIHFIHFLLSCIVQTVLKVKTTAMYFILLTTVNVNIVLTFHLCAQAILNAYLLFNPVAGLLCGGFCNGAKLTLEYARSCTRGSTSLSPF